MYFSASSLSNALRHEDRHKTLTCYNAQNFSFKKQDEIKSQRISVVLTSCLQRALRGENSLWEGQKVSVLSPLQRKWGYLGLAIRCCTTQRRRTLPLNLVPQWWYVLPGELFNLSPLCLVRDNCYFDCVERYGT